MLLSGQGVFELVLVFSTFFISTLALLYVVYSCINLGRNIPYGKVVQGALCLGVLSMVLYGIMR